MLVITQENPSPCQRGFPVLILAGTLHYTAELLVSGKGLLLVLGFPSVCMATPATAFSASLVMVCTPQGTVLRLVLAEADLTLHAPSLTSSHPSMAALA